MSFRLNRWLQHQDSDDGMQYVTMTTEQNLKRQISHYIEQLVEISGTTWSRNM